MIPILRVGFKARTEKRVDGFLSIYPNEEMIVERPNT
jgi:hypothetical protein